VAAQLVLHAPGASQPRHERGGPAVVGHEPGDVAAVPRGRARDRHGTCGAQPVGRPVGGQASVERATSSNIPSSSSVAPGPGRGRSTPPFGSPPRLPRCAGSRGATRCPGAAARPVWSRAMTRPSVCVVGPGWRFTSGISHFTCLPRRGTGRHVRHLGHPDPAAATEDVLPGPGARRGAGHHAGARSEGRGLRRHRLVLGSEPVSGRSGGCGTGTRTPCCCSGGRARSHTPTWCSPCWPGGAGARVLIEFHEIQDTGEARIPLVSAYNPPLAAGAVAARGRSRRTLRTRP